MAFCYGCGRTESRNPTNNRLAWYHNYDVEANRLCYLCYDKFIVSKESKRKKWIKYNPNHMFFLGLSIYLGWNPRKGFCTDCGQKRRTELHHWFYLIIMPWACTQELCVRCHDKTKRVNRDPSTGRFALC